MSVFPFANTYHGTQRIDSIDLDLLKTDVNLNVYISIYN